MPEIPNAHALAAMLATVVALALFSRARARLEVTSLGLIAALALAFSLFPFDGCGPAELFSGFGHEALIAVCALMVLGQGLVRTGALEPVGRLLSRFWGKLPFLAFAATLVIAAVLSAFVNNTPVVVLLLPILISVCARTATSPSGVLMPMGLATLVGGTATTIGTSTNLLVVSIAADLGAHRFTMFEFLLPAAIAGTVALAYLWLIAPRLLPKRELGLAGPSPRLLTARPRIDTNAPADAGIDPSGTGKALIALGIVALVVAPAAVGALPIAVSGITGVVAMLLTRCLNVAEALRAISPSVFFVVVASLALGRALTETGATLYATELFLFAMQGASPAMILGGLMLLLAVLTNIVSNNAAAVIGTPIAIGIAHELGLPPEPFVLAVLFGANLSYATPMAYQTNLLVMSAGNYRFGEFAKVGLPLIALMLITLTWVLTKLYL